MARPGTWEREPDNWDLHGAGCVCVTSRALGRTDRNRRPPTVDVRRLPNRGGRGGREGIEVRRSLQTADTDSQTDKLKHDGGPCIESCRASGYSPPPRRTQDTMKRCVSILREMPGHALDVSAFVSQPAPGRISWPTRLCISLLARSLSSLLRRRRHGRALERPFQQGSPKGLLTHVPLPTPPAGSARPSAGRSARKLPSPGHPCSDIPCRHGTQGRPAAHDWLGVWSSQSAPCAPHHNLLRTDGPYQDHHPCCPAPLLDGSRNIACCQRFPQPNLADH